MYNQKCLNKTCVCEFCYLFQYSFLGMDDVSCSQVVKLPDYMHDLIPDLAIFGGTFGRVETKYHKKSKYKIFPNDQNSSKF